MSTARDWRALAGDVRTLATLAVAAVLILAVLALSLKLWLFFIRWAVR